MHVCPDYGPMFRPSMVSILLKGRLSREGISITVSEPGKKSCTNIQKFILTGNSIYFEMPYYFSSNKNQMIVNINIYYKKKKLYESQYLYTQTLDRKLMFCFILILYFYVIVFLRTTC